MTFETSLSEAVEFGLADAKKQKNILTNSLAREQFVSALSILLESKTIEHTELLRSTAKQIRDEECGKRLILRGLVEFSSYCVNDCRYCGLNRTNTKATRYRLSEDEILKAARSIHASGISTIVLQSGEDKTSAAYLTSIITRIKTQYPLAITLSVGEKTTDEFAEWKKAGADRYLMRVESSNPELYKNLHIGRRVESRIDCLKTLKVQDWQVGSGIMIGPPGQTIAHIAQDILFFAEHNFDMIGIGPFIPHPDTVFHSEKTGNIELSLNSVALTRIITRNTWLPATTAIASLEKDYRLDALNSGANVIMPSFTPQRVRKNYEIYPGKHCFEESNAQCIKELAALATRAGLSLDLSRADTLKTHSNMKIPCYTVKREERKLMKIPKSILFIVALTSFAACSSPKTVRAMADKKKLTLGVAIQAGDIYDPASVTLLQENFNLLVAENTSKWKLIRPSLKFWNWSDMDKMVEFAETNKMKMKWHTFVWHQQNPPYVDGLKTRDDAIAMLTEHITTIMSRYKGRIWEYDVCNEVLNEDGTMRDTVWLRTIGPEYLDIAFKTARETDPKARLLLNDYNNEYAGTAKGDGFYRLVKDLQDRGIPIDGVGFQLHAVAKYGIDETALRKNIQRFNDLGLFVSFTEIDVRVEIPLTEKKEAEQTAAYKKLMEVALSESNAGSFILWGYTDAKSWIPAAFGGYGSAHPFDREVKPKPVWAELQKMLNDAKPRKK